jgi:hypothetical protein
MSIFRKHFNGMGVLRHALGAFPLLHEPTSQHGGGIFLNPKIEKRADLLAEIGGMAKSREAEFASTGGVMVNWTEQIRNRCGKELLSRGMFPPRKYFISGD